MNAELSLRELFDRALVQRWRGDISTLEYQKDATGFPADRIAGGGFGTVFRATITVKLPNPNPAVGHRIALPNSRCVIKLIPSKDNQETRASVAEIDRQQMYVNESAWKGFDYPAINRFLTMDTTRFISHGYWMICSDEAECTLADLILSPNMLILAGSERIRCNKTRRCCCALGIACGVAYLSFLGFVHRDLKPANVLLDTDFMPKLTDFGLLLSVTNEKVSTFAGTLPYVAPEIVNRKPGDPRRVSEKIDVYALGLILMELFSPDAIPADHLNEQAIPPEAGESLEEVIRGAIAQDPAVRWNIKQVVLRLLDPDTFGDLDGFGNEPLDLAFFNAYKERLMTRPFSEALTAYQGPR